MGIPEHTEGYSCRAFVISVIVIIVGAFACSTLLTLAIDHSCIDAAQSWLPAYPEAELIEERFTFLSMYGVGTSSRVLYTPDEVLEVRRWYMLSDSENARTETPRSLANLRWLATEAPDGEGTIIQLVSNCANALDLSPLGISNAS